MPLETISKRFVGRYEYTRMRYLDIKALHVCHEMGDSWHVYVLIPRETIRNHLREKDIVRGLCDVRDPSQWVPPNPFLQCEHYGGPGQPFVGTPWLYARTRDYFVYYQNGGWDV